MKRLLAITVVLAVLTSLLVPASAFAKGPGGPHEGEKYAIVIGISNYPGPNSVLKGGLDLFYADDDARAVKDMLGQHGFGSNNIVMIADGRATKQAILQQIEKVAEEAHPGDEVVFYFSGHAVIPEAEFPDPVASLWPGDAPAGSDVGMLVWNNDHTTTDVVFDTELQAAFSEFPSSVQIMFGFDSCWAGRFEEIEGPGRFVAMASGSGADAIAGEYGKAYKAFGMGALPGIGWMDQGIFTYFFAVQGLTWNLAPDLDGDGVISVEEAFFYAQVCVGAFSDNSGGLLKEYPIYDDETDGDFHL